MDKFNNLVLSDVLKNKLDKEKSLELEKLGNSEDQNLNYRSS